MGVDRVLEGLSLQLGVDLLVGVELELVCLTILLHSVINSIYY